MPIAVKHDHKDQSEYAYIQVKDVEELLKNGPNIPYKVNFSLSPYIDMLKQRYPNACDNTKMALTPVLENSQIHLESNSCQFENITKNAHFQTLLSLVIPSLIYNNELSYVSSPFKKDFIAKTSTFEVLFNSEDWQLKIDQEMLAKSLNKNIQHAGIHILNTLYGQDINNEVGEILTIKNKNTELERHFRIHLKFDFIKVKNVKPLPKINQAQINFLLKNQDDLDLWLKHLPEDTFEFWGFTIGNLYDITDIQILSDIKQWISFSKDMRPQAYFHTLGSYIQSYLRNQDIKAGGFLIDQGLSLQEGNTSVTGVERFYDLVIQDEVNENKGIFDHIISAKRVLYIDNLLEISNPSKSEQQLIDKGIRSYALSPILDFEGKILSIFELSSTKANTFNYLSVPKLQPIFDQMKLSFESYSSEISNRVTDIIQKNFTSIHPSVSWKFEKVAKEYLSQKQADVKDLTIAPIIFENVYPLYGQSDIIDSSNIRNECIQKDLTENLSALVNLLDKWTSQKKLHLLESYQISVNKILKDLKKEFISTDESRIVKLITEEIHPVLETVSNRHPELSQKSYKDYLSILDPNLKIVYRKRKSFEKSVTKMNLTISDYMEKDEAIMQNILPHFFEKYKTDGVEYNLYLGQSLLNEGLFSTNDLKNFRLWQLVNSCEVTRLAEKTSETLDLPLKTAQLIFVYNNSLSIRFRMDEKKFDVDGAYNVRYEILKKRIDKAVIKGSNERLTQHGKVAIVYISEKDKMEYLEFMDYLIAKGYIENDIEELELDKLQGADGLRALRITVKH